MVIYLNAHIILDYIRNKGFEHSIILIDEKLYLLIWIVLHIVIMIFPLFNVKLVGFFISLLLSMFPLTGLGLVSS